MSILNHSDLNSDITANIDNNGAQAITGLILQQRLLNLADSSVNKLGDLTIQGLLRYSVLPTISNNGDITHKNYVDSTIASSISALSSVYLALNGSNSPSANINWGGYGISNTTGLSRGDNVVTLGTNDISIEAIIPGTGGTSAFLHKTLGFSVLFTVSGNTRALTFDNNGIGLKTSNFYSYLKTDLVTANRTIQFPDASGTVALTSDISGFLSNTLSSSKIFVGNGSNIATGVDLTLSSSGGSFALSNAGVLTMPNADTSTRGLLTSTDWNTFNNKVSTSRALNINGISQDLSADRSWRTGMADTGVFSFVGLTYNSGTTINIGAVEGQIVNNETNPLIPTYTHVSYAGATNVSVTTVGSGLASYVMIDSAGAISFQNTFPTSTERKSKIYLGKIGHPTGTINSSAIGNEPDYIISPIAQLRAIYKAIGFINNGVIASANGANLNFNISSGVVTRYASNFVTDKTIPNEITISAGTPQSFLYRTQTGAGGGFITAIDPTMYDVAGTITAIPGGGATSTNQYIYCVPGLGFIVQYGQVIYNSLTDAISGVGKEAFTVYSSLVSNAILVGVISVQKDAIALNNTNKARFFIADKFGQSGGSTAGISTATFQNTYNNSLQPQILTSTSLGSLQVKRGSAADTDSVFEILNGSGTSKYSITGEGRYTSLSGAINGTGGNGYLEIVAQSSNASAPTSGFRLFAGPTGSFSWTRKNGSDTYVRTFDSTLSADRTWSFPDITDTVVTLTAAQTLTNKTITNPTLSIRDDLFTITDDGDSTKRLQFQLSSITTGTTRTLTVPNVSDTLAVLGLAQTFTAKQTFNSATTEFSAITLLDTTYKTALDVSATNVLRIGNGFTSIESPVVFKVTNTNAAAGLNTGSLQVSGGSSFANSMYVFTTNATPLNIRGNTSGTARIVTQNDATSSTINYAGQYYQVKNASAAYVSAGQIIANLTTTTGGSETSAIEFQTYLSGTIATRFSITGSTARFTGEVQHDTTISLLDTTYKTALSVQSATTLELGNGFTQLYSNVNTIILSAVAPVLRASNSGSQLNIQVSGGSSAQNGVVLTTVSNNTHTSGSTRAFRISQTFAPTTGSGNYTGIDFTPLTLNQTGTSGAGVITLIDLVPTVTSISGTLYGLRSQIAASPTGGGTAWNIYADGTANNGFGGNVKLLTAGNGFYIKEGTNATMGTSTLVGGTVTVSTTKVTATSRIYLTIQSLGTVTVPKSVGVTARSAGISFTITSADATDTSVISWVIIEPS